MPRYTWSSPLALYDRAGNGYVFVADSAGNLFLYEGATGKELAVLSGTKTGSSGFSASPDAFDGDLVIGGEEGTIYGIHLS